MIVLLKLHVVVVELRYFFLEGRSVLLSRLGLDHVLLNFCLSILGQNRKENLQTVQLSVALASVLVLLHSVDEGIVYGFHDRTLEVVTIHRSHRASFESSARAAELVIRVNLISIVIRVEVPIVPSIVKVGLGNLRRILLLIVKGYLIDLLAHY